jgi:surface protein
MFLNCTNFNQSLNSWDVGSVTNMNSMFYGNSNFNQPLSSWTVSAVTNMSSMFASAINFNQSLSSWDVSNVTTMNSMLDGTSISVTNYNNILTGWTGWDGTGATKSVQSNVNFGASGRQYSTGTTAQAARLYLITGKTWTITDAGGI